MFDTTSRYKNLVCMCNEGSKTTEFERLPGWYYKWEWLMKCAIEVALCDMKYTQTLMTIGLGIQVILRGCNVGITDERNL
jgi:hypothetical protein